MTQPRTTIAALVRGKPVELPVDQVAYFKADCKYTAAHHPGGTLLLRDPIKTLAEELGEAFIHIHKATLVARSQVLEIVRMPLTKDCYIVLKGRKEQLKISRGRYRQVCQALSIRPAINRRR